MYCFANKDLVWFCRGWGSVFMATADFSTWLTWSGVRSSARCELIELFITLVTIERPVTPPRVRNWVIAPIAVAAIVSFDRIENAQYEPWSPLSQFCGTSKSRVVMLIPRPNPRRTWKPYWDSEILVLIGSVDNEADPATWSTAAMSSRNTGGTLGLEARKDAKKDPQGELKVSGKRRMPAPSGETTFVAWSLWGICTMAIV